VSHRKQPTESTPRNDNDILSYLLGQIISPSAKMAGVASWRVVLTIAIAMNWNRLSVIYNSVERIPEIAHRVEKIESNQADMSRRIERIEAVMIAKGLMTGSLMGLPSPIPAGLSYDFSKPHN
jgi:hypothetical protein